MTLIELKQLIAKKLGIALSSIGAEDFKAYGVRFHYLGSTYRATTDLTVEKVDGACLVTDDDARHIEKLLHGEEWDGEGLPPVGVECEMSYAGDEWHKCVIIAKGEEQIIYKREGCEEFSGHRNNYRFRPIRSEADKRRDEIIDALKEGLGHAHGLYDLMQIYHLLNNGKIPHIRID